jgi:hypothetical protein
MKTGNPKASFGTPEHAIFRGAVKAIPSIRMKWLFLILAKFDRSTERISTSVEM